MSTDNSRPTRAGIYRCTRKVGGMKQTVYRYYKGGNCLYTDDWADPNNLVGERVEDLRNYEGPFVLLKEVEEPKVIIGMNQRVEEGGWYWSTGVGFDSPTLVRLSTNPDFIYAKGHRYIKAEPPVFPPFPVKPELKLYRVKNHESCMVVGELFWGFVDADSRRVFPGNFDPSNVEEVKDV